MVKVFTNTKTERKRLERLAALDELKEEVVEEQPTMEAIEEEIKDVMTYIPSRGLNFNSRKKTLCDKLREIYQRTDDVQIKEMCVDATLMAKKITKRLKWYAEQGTKK